MKAIFSTGSGKALLAVLVLATRLAPTAAAQTETPPSEETGATIQRLPSDLIHDEIRIWTSPFRASSYSSHTVKKYVIPFALISAGLIAADRRISDALPNTADQAKWSGRVSQAGAWYSVGGVAGATYLLGKFADDNHARETGLLGLEALAHAQLVVFGMKEITNRQRPLDSDGHGGFWEGGNSFPSGHAASAFAVATVYAYEYREHIAVPIAAYSAATLVSMSRIGARRHWPSDIFVGGSIGFLLGRYVYKSHHDPELPGSPVKKMAKLMPEFGMTPSGMGLAWRW